ncbi:hypothetical protein B0H12DRAFT_1171667 [Mycena haematopus]|nr:hypothetical protein B0H12DRAFT_1171667 [Mycena haematopus]
MFMGGSPAEGIQPQSDKQKKVNDHSEWFTAGCSEGIRPCVASTDYYVSLHGSAAPGAPVVVNESSNLDTQKWEVKSDGNKFTIGLAGTAATFAVAAEDVSGAKIILRSVKQDYELIEEKSNQYKIKVNGKDLVWDMVKAEDLTQIQVKPSKEAVNGLWLFLKAN